MSFVFSVFVLFPLLCDIATLSRALDAFFSLHNGFCNTHTHTHKLGTNMRNKKNREESKSDVSAGRAFYSVSERG